MLLYNIVNLNKNLKKIMRENKEGFKGVLEEFKFLMEIY